MYEHLDIISESENRWIGHKLPHLTFISINISVVWNWFLFYSFLCHNHHNLQSSFSRSISMTRILSPNIASPVTTSRQLKPEEISCSVASGDCTSAHSTVLQLHSSLVLRCYSSALLSNWRVAVVVVMIIQILLQYRVWILIYFQTLNASSVYSTGNALWYLQEE